MTRGHGLDKCIDAVGAESNNRIHVSLHIFFRKGAEGDLGRSASGSKIPS
jgi:hypothetical protein